MAIIYVDPVGGNDSYNGLSFANRKRTFSSAQSVMSNGDTVRIIQSPNPTLVGPAAWTRDDKFVTLTTPVTANIDSCDAGWVGSTNVTVAHTALNRKEGTNMLSLTIAAGFTTGKVAYKTLSAATDFSAYSQISLWLRQNSGTLSSIADFSIRLCSDTTGDVPVNSTGFPMQNIGVAGNWMPFTMNVGQALGTAIRSIAIYRTMSRGAQAILIDNIIACKSADQPDSLSLTSLISKNNGEAWAPIRSINGTTIGLDCAPNTYASDVFPQYAGETETVPLYKRECLRPSTMAASLTDSVPTGGSVTTGGTANLRRYWSGGWNSTDMSTQVGDTYLDGTNGQGWPLYVGAFATVSNIGVVRSAAGIIIQGDSIEVNMHTISGCSTNPIYMAVASNSTVNVQNVSYNNASATQSALGYVNGGNFNNVLNVVNVNSNAGLGWQTGVANVTGASNGAQYRETYNITNMINNNAGGALFSSLVDSKATIGNLYGPFPLVVGQSTIAFTAVGQGTYNSTIKVTGTIHSTHTNGDAIRLFAAADCTLDLRGATITLVAPQQSAILFSHNADVKVLGGTVAGGRVTYDIADSLMVGTVFPASTSYPRPNDPHAWPSRVRVQDFDGVIGDHRLFMSNGLAQTVDTPLHGDGSTSAWRLSASNPGANIYVTSPPGYYNELEVARVAVGAGTPVTASIWVQRSSATVQTARFVLKGGQIDGVPNDVVATATGAANTWEQLTLTFTPTTAGVVSFVVQQAAANATANWSTFDDFNVGQA